MREYDKPSDRLALSPLHLSACTHTLSACLSVYCLSEALMHGLTQPCMALSFFLRPLTPVGEDAIVYARRYASRIEALP